MAPIELVAIMTPKPGRADKMIERFNACAAYVKANEPYIFRYELHRATQHKDGKERFIILEGYDSKEAQEKHIKTQPVIDLIAAVKTEVDSIEVIDTQLHSKL